MHSSLWTTADGGSSASSLVTSPASVFGGGGGGLLRLRRRRRRRREEEEGIIATGVESCKPDWGDGNGPLFSSCFVYRHVSIGGPTPIQAQAHPVVIFIFENTSRVT